MKIMNCKFPQLTMAALLATAFTLQCSSPDVVVQEADSPQSVSAELRTSTFETFEPAAISIELIEEPVILSAIEPEPTEPSPEPEPVTPSATSTQCILNGYSTVEMPDGNIWMAENLNIEMKGFGKCYDNDPANCNTYGRLYTWKEAVEIADSIAKYTPDWRLPTDADWTALTNAIGITPGTKLRAPSWGGTDDFGFSGLPAGDWIPGDRNQSGSFNNIGKSTKWWSATEVRGNTADAWTRHPNGYLLNPINIAKSRGYSVRLVCIKD